MEIGGLQKLNFFDYPEKVSCTVFIVGCNFRCPWCYSPEFVLPERIKDQPRISEKDFFNFLKEKKKLLEGVCISGGEPTIHPELPEFIKKIKRMGYFVKLDTNGSNPKALRELIEKELVDYIALDIKAPKDKYLQIVGLPENGLRRDFLKGELVERIEESIKILKEGKVDYEFKTTIVPGFLKKEDILEIAKWIGPAKKYHLQNFRPEKTIDPKFRRMKPFPLEYLAYIKKAISPFFEICKIEP
jgi:pyruvate formate lyase activating enzyme